MFFNGGGGGGVIVCYFPNKEVVHWLTCFFQPPGILSWILKKMFQIVTLKQKETTIQKRFLTKKTKKQN